jgi:hypothetical protein
MKPKYQLLIDEDCPMCRTYGTYLTKSNIIQSTSYQQMREINAPHIDFDKARNKIALVNTEDNSVTYGIESLLKAFGSKYRAISQISKSEMAIYVLNIFYSFISYNRKLIYPARPRQSFFCIPDFSLPYRLAYIIIAGLITVICLQFYGADMMASLGLKPNILRELAVCFGQVVWQAFWFRKIEKELLWDYLGNMMTVSLIGSILLVPMLLVMWFMPILLWIQIAYFLLVVTIMLFEHKRRCDIIGLPIWLSISWVLYRMVVMVILVVVGLQIL